MPNTQRVSIEGSDAGGGGGGDLSESAALRETRATYMPAAGEVPDWEKEEAALAFLDEEDVSRGCGWTFVDVFIRSLSSMLTLSPPPSVTGVHQGLQRVERLLL